MVVLSLKNRSDDLLCCVNPVLKILYFFYNPHGDFDFGLKKGFVSCVCGIFVVPLQCYKGTFKSSNLQILSYYADT